MFGINHQNNLQADCFISQVNAINPYILLKFNFF